MFLTTIIGLFRRPLVLPHLGSLTGEDYQRAHDEDAIERRCAEDYAGNWHEFQTRVDPYEQR